jgi:hypothetical protein
MLVQPLRNASLGNRVLGVVTRGTPKKLLFFADLRAVLMDGEHGYEIGFSVADAANKCGGDCGGPSPQKQPVARRLNCGANHSKVVEEIASGTHIVASAPGGTESLSRASGIGLIGLIGGNWSVLSAL